jgi:hypothetical protein
MPVRFMGGPLDGKTLEHNQIDALVYECPQPTESGKRDFVTVPAFVDWQRILRGELSRDEASAYFTYERVSPNESTLEFRHVSDGEQWHAICEAARLHDERFRIRARTVTFAALLLGFALYAVTVSVFGKSQPLTLIAVYAIYLPHFFVRDLVSEGGLRGLFSGREFLTGWGRFLLLSSLFCGDLAFWIASVLFASGQFHSARIAGGIALGLSAILYPMLSRSRLNQTGGSSAFGLRLVAMALLVGTAWWCAR